LSYKETEMMGEQATAEFRGSGPATAKGTGMEAEALAVFRRVRDEIRNWILNTY
jgi:hypothetical protein